MPHIKKILMPLALAFCAASTRLPAQNAPSPMEGLWKTQMVDAVVEVKNCSVWSPCVTLYWLNPQDKDIYQHFGDGRKELWKVTSDDIMALCGFSPRTYRGQALSDSAWKGKLDLRGMGMSVDISIQQTANDTLSVHASKSIGIGRLRKTVNQHEQWTRVQPGDPKYPACKKP